MGQKSKLLILSEYVNKWTENIGGMWTNENSYWENEALSDISTRNILHHRFYKLNTMNQVHFITVHEIQSLLFQYVIGSDEVTIL